MYYKYMSPVTGRIVLENGTLRWSTPQLLNDIFDMQFDLHVDVDREAVRRAALQMMWDALYGDENFPIENSLGIVLSMAKAGVPNVPRDEFDRIFNPVVDKAFENLGVALPELQERIRSILAQCKILCLTGAPDNEVMWAHYAEKSQGVVLKFCQVDGLNSLWHLARSMNYVPRMPRLMDEAFFASYLAGRAKLDTPTVLDRVVYTKSQGWAYEREMRIFRGMGKIPDADCEDLPFHPAELEQVIFGPRMSERDRRDLTKVVRGRYPHTALMQALPSARQFQFEIVPIG